MCALQVKPIKQDYAKSLREARRYFLGREPYAKKYYRKIIKFGKIKPDSVIVDVPCGTGNLAYRIMRKVQPQFYLIDLNPLMLLEAKKHCKNCRLIEGKASDIDKIVKKNLDLIICTNGFESYVGDQTEFLKKCFKVLKPTGTLIFDISTRGIYNEYTIQFMKQWKNEIIKALKNEFPNADPRLVQKWFNLFNKKDLNQLIKKLKILGFNVKLLKYLESWSIEKELKMYSKVEARTDRWLPSLRFSTRKKLLNKTAIRAAEKIGHKPLPRYRLFFVCSKL